jgi:hypothetical protein
MSPADNFPPVFATNHPERGETVAGEINRLLGGLREELINPPALAIATAYLNPGGFDLIADEVEQAPVVRLLLGADPQPARSIGRTEASPTASIEEALKAGRDRVGFTVEDDAAARRLVGWLRHAAATGEPQVEVRRFTKGFLHGKAFIAIHPTSSAVLAGSSNFTYAGLAINRELNLGYPKGQYTGLVIDWFNELWDESEDFDLAAFYEARWVPHAPWIVFLRMLHEMYSWDDGHVDRRLGLDLLGFQKDGVERALRLMDELGGVLVCDEVGLGKTFIAGEIIHQASVRDRQQVLVVTPAALKESNWVPFLRKYNLYSNRVHVVTYDDVRIGTAKELQNIDQYALVVIDEAHNLRNPATQRAQAVMDILGGEYRKKLLLLTATPVNNSLHDLQSLVSYFIRNDAQFASIGIPSITKYIKQAQAQDPQALSPEHLFDLMDRVAVRRTRGFIKSEYAGEEMVGPDGNKVAIEFPTPHLHRVDYTLTPQGQKLLDGVVHALEDPDSGSGSNLYDRLRERCDDESRLSMARYMPSLYALDDDVENRQISTAGLLESILLKRLESSAEALKNTLDTLISSHETFLRALKGGKILSGKLLTDFGAADDDLDEFLAEVDDERMAGVDDATDFDTKALGARIQQDIAVLTDLHRLAEHAAAVDDPKVGRIVEILEVTAREAARPSKDGISEGDRRKVIVFSTFTDTTLHLREQVVKAIDSAPDDTPLAAYKGRIPHAVYGSKQGVSQESRAGIIAGFAPATAGAVTEDGVRQSEDRYDVLFATDVLSEGVNLQQAGHIISVDLPWNPMRLVQRHGRIDRIGSHHKYIEIDCFFPAADLDRLLKLEERLQRKVAYANAAIGMGKVIPGQIADPTVEVSLNDTREQIDALHDEKADIFESRGGSAALSGEEYRRRLEKAFDDPRVKADVLNLPYCAGSGFVSSSIKRPGWVFCTKIGDSPQPWFRFVPADAEWRPIHRAEDDAPWVIGDTLTALIAADPGGAGTEQHIPDAARAGVFDAWQVAEDDIYAKWTALTDPAALQPEVPLALREAHELVTEHGGGLGFAAQQGLLSVLDASWEKRIVDRVRAIVRDDGVSGTEKVDQLQAFVKEAGLEAPPPPQPLPPIEHEDIRLVCWMAVSTRLETAPPSP